MILTNWKWPYEDLAIYYKFSEIKKKKRGNLQPDHVSYIYLRCGAIRVLVLTYCYLWICPCVTNVITKNTPTRTWKLIIKRKKRGETFSFFDAREISGILFAIIERSQKSWHDLNKEMLKKHPWNISGLKWIMPLGWELLNRLILLCMSDLSCKIIVLQKPQTTRIGIWSVCGSKVCWTLIFGISSHCWPWEGLKIRKSTFHLTSCLHTVSFQKTCD